MQTSSFFRKQCFASRNEFVFVFSPFAFSNRACQFRYFSRYSCRQGRLLLTGLSHCCFEQFHSLRSLRETTVLTLANRYGSLTLLTSGALTSTFKTRSATEIVFTLYLESSMSYKHSELSLVENRAERNEELLRSILVGQSVASSYFHHSLRLEWLRLLQLNCSSSVGL